MRRASVQEKNFDPHPKSIVFTDQFVKFGLGFFVSPVAPKDRLVPLGCVVWLPTCHEPVSLATQTATCAHEWSAHDTEIDLQWRLRVRTQNRHPTGCLLRMSLINTQLFCCIRCRLQASLGLVFRWHLSSPSLYHHAALGMLPSTVQPLGISAARSVVTFDATRYGRLLADMRTCQDCLATSPHVFVRCYNRRLYKPCNGAFVDFRCRLLGAAVVLPPVCLHRPLIDLQAASLLGRRSFICEPAVRQQLGACNLLGAPMLWRPSMAAPVSFGHIPVGAGFR